MATGLAVVPYRLAVALLIPRCLLSSTFLERCNSWRESLVQSSHCGPSCWCTGGAIPRSIILARRRQDIHQSSPVLTSARPRLQSSPSRTLSRFPMATVNTAVGGIPTDIRLFKTSTSTRSPGPELARSRSPSSARPNTRPVSCRRISTSTMKEKEMPKDGLMVVVEKLESGLVGTKDAGELVTCRSVSVHVYLPYDTEQLLRVS